MPGLIDLHSHVFEGIGEGVNADEYGLKRGTTTTVDGGSAGARSFGAFRTHHRPESLPDALLAEPEQYRTGGLAGRGVDAGPLDRC